MIYYVMFYTETTDEKRTQNLAAVSMSDYVIDCFQKICGKVTILSNSKPIPGIRIKTERKKLRKGVVLHTFASLKVGNTIINKLNTVLGLTQLLFYIMKNCKEGDVVCVYHSMGYRALFSFIKRINKKIRYILEVNELYQYVEVNTSDFKKKENMLFEAADAFICTNNYMEEQINTADITGQRKPSAVVSGIYRSFPRLAEKEKHDTKVLVYAGSFEPQKGADLVLGAAEYLNSNFEVRVVGFGRQEDIKRVQNKIRHLAKLGCKVRYDGLYKGDELNKYLQACDIGLCLQYPDDELNWYEFPSKILLYMANDLNVITNDLGQVKSSPVGEYLNIVETDDVKEIARYINNEEYRLIDVREGLKTLDLGFKNNLHDLLRKLTEPGKK